MGINEILRIGQRVKDLRLKKNISLTNMAKILGISKTTYANYEADRRNMPNDIIAMVSLILSEPMDWILGSQTNEPYMNPYDYLNESQKIRMIEYCYDLPHDKAAKYVQTGEIPEGFEAPYHFGQKVYGGGFFTDIDDDMNKIEINNYYNMLNETGKAEAVKRVEELTHIDKYTKSEEDC